MNRLLNVSGIILSIILFHSCEDKPVLPSLTTKTITEISTTTAVSGGRITDDGGAQIIAAGVCWNTSDDPTTENSRTIEGGDLSSFTSNITQLLPNTTYFIRAYATNSVGTGYGKSVSFRTLGDKPTSSSLNASNITINSVTFNSSVNANLLSTTVTFEYGLTTSYGNTVTIPQNPITGNSNVNVTADLTGLTPGTTYHFRIKTENSLGVTTSGDMTFTTLGKMPDVTVSAATNLHVTSVTVNGSVNPNYLQSTVEIEWGTTTSYGNKITPTQSPVTGNTTVNISAVLEGLTPGAKYHFRIKSENSLGITYSGDMSFTLPGKVPGLTLGSVSNITTSSATLSALLNPNHLPTSLIIEYGADDNYGNSLIVTKNPVIGSSDININVNLDELTELTAFHYRFIAENELGTTISNDMTFSTTGIVSDIDGNIYKAVLIGNQKWMAENLRTKHFSNGDPILNGETAVNYCDQNAYYFNYNMDPTITSVYGLLYNYYAASKSTTIEPTRSNSIPSGIQGACPTGWHLPSFPEFEILVNFLGGPEIAGGKLKSLHLWDLPNLGASNYSGFNSLPAGEYNKLNFGYSYLGIRTFLWSCSGDSDYLYGISLNCSSSQVSRQVRHRCNGASIRCVKD